MNTKLSTDELNRPDISSFRDIPKLPVVIVLENIRSRSNIGSVFRSADAFLMDEIVLCGYTAQPPHRDIQKTALGATESVNWRYEKDCRDAVNDLKKRGFSIYAVEQTTESVLIQDFNFEHSAPLALIFGNEVEGVSENILSICDGTIEIAQFGTKHSLNVSVCAGIVMHAANLRLYNSSMG